MSPQQLPSHRYHPARRPPRPGVVHTVFGAAAVLALYVAVTGGSAGRAWAFLDHAAGVLALVSLSVTVLWGLAATDRLVLGPAHRLLAQGVHRGTAVAGLCFLGLHVWVKVASGVTAPAAAALPLGDRDRPVLIGLGTLAGYLFVAVAVTGAVRAAFARRGCSRWWRALHMSAYPAWGAALVHGLRAGRHASGWVTAGYALCLAGVVAVLILRLVPPAGPEATPRSPAVTPPGAGPEAAPRSPAAAPPGAGSEAAPRRAGPAAAPPGAGPETAPRRAGPEAAPPGAGPEAAPRSPAVTPPGTGPEATPRRAGPEAAPRSKERT